MMKLGSQTGSATNHILSRQTIGQPDPTVDMGATILCWTDRHAATVTKIESLAGRTYVTVQEDTATRTDKNGMSESQEYDYMPNPKGRVQTYRQTVTGGWQAVSFNTVTKRWNKDDGPGLRLGSREEYHDFSF